jgi:hypothetical protein
MDLPDARDDSSLNEPLKLHRDCEMDLKYLLGVMRERMAQIDEMRKTLREQLDLAQLYRNAVLAFIVAIYVPLSFVTVRCLFWQFHGRISSSTHL